MYGVPGIITIAERVLTTLLIVTGVATVFVVPPQTVSLGEWLVMPGAHPTAVSPVLHFDATAAALLLVAGCVALLRLPDSQANRAHPSAFGRLALLPLTAVAVMSTNLVALVVTWILLDVVLGGTGREVRSDTVETRSSPWPLLRLSSACLLVAVLVGVSRYHTTDLLEIARSAASDERVDAAQVVAGLSVCLAAAAAIRCGLFPAILWLRRYFESSDRPDMSDVLLVTIIPGCGLVVRLASLSGGITNGTVLLAGLGALTGIAAAMIAATQTSAERVFPLLCLSVVAMACAGSVSAGPDYAAVALPTVLILIPLLAAVFRSGHSNSDASSGSRIQLDTITRNFGIGVLISGLAGSNAILGQIRAEALASPELLALGLPRERVCNAIWIACVFGQCLFAFALVRGVTRRSNMPAQAPGSDRVPARQFFGSVAVIAGVILAAWLLPLRESLSPAPPGADVSTASFMVFGPATPAALLGAVVAWLLYRDESATKENSARGLDSLHRLGRNWFYLEQAWRFGVAGPIRVLSFVATLVDRHLISSGREEAWRVSATAPAAGIEHLRRTGPVYYGLGIVLVVAGLLLVLR